MRITTSSTTASCTRHDQLPRRNAMTYAAGSVLGRRAHGWLQHRYLRPARGLSTSGRQGSGRQQPRAICRCTIMALSDSARSFECAFAQGTIRSSLAREHRRHQASSTRGVREPYDTYRRLRDDEPVAWSDELNGWLVTRWDDWWHALKNTLCSPRGASICLPHGASRTRPADDVVDEWPVSGFGCSIRHQHTRVAN